MEKKYIDEAIDELVSVTDWARWGASQFEAAQLFYGHGTDNAWDEAMHLLLHSLHIAPQYAQQVLSARLTRSEREKVAALFLRRIKEHRPAAYLIQEAWFAGMRFYVDERVLIPRSPIAELIHNEFSPWLQEAPQRIADVCTGSGCIASACAMVFPDAQVDALDISQDALDVARINIEAHGLSERVHLINSDLLNEVADVRYDLIVSNPPYVPEQRLAQLPDEFTHEPALGLVSGPDGLDCVLRLLKQAKAHLNPGGLLVVEVGLSQEALVQHCPTIPFTWVEFSHGGEGVFVLTTEQLHSIPSTG